ncbi:MAG TPA: ATP-binding protein, partial [Candidatus Dormibacteraeota bacterium]|nr:ATP-binding protein [Candidatus Dormibacteraeota bacterium]
RMALITLVAAMAVAFSDTGLSLTRHYPFVFLVALSAGLAVAYHHAAKSGAEVNALLTTQFLVDVAVISYLLLFTGGTSSQFAPLFLLAPLMGGIFLTVRGGLLFAAAAGLAYGAFYVAEVAGMVPPMAYGLTERLSEPALRLRLILYLPLLFIVGAIGGAIGRSLREGRLALDEARAQLNRALFDTETILENLSSGLATIDAGGSVRHWNRAASEILAVPTKAVQGRHYLETFGPGLEAFSTRLREALERGTEGTRYEVTVLTANGRTVPLGISTSLLLGASGERRGVIALFQDLSEVKALEDRIRRGETLAAIGELSAGIAHEIRNCLNPITGSVEVLQKELRVEGENARLLDLVVRESERLDRFVSELLEYARERPLKTEKVEVAALASESIEIARRHASAGKGKKASLEGPNAPIWVRADFDQMKQVMTNLLINAFEAIEGTGNVTVRIREERRTPGAWGRAGGPRVVMEVADTGTGIGDKDVAQVFEPFFSTKQGGTGLGLAIANRIVERHGGNIEVESRVGEGTTMRLWLPQADTPARSVAHAA